MKILPAKPSVSFPTGRSDVVWSLGRERGERALRLRPRPRYTGFVFCWDLSVSRMISSSSTKYLENSSMTSWGLNRSTARLIVVPDYRKKIWQSFTHMLQPLNTKWVSSPRGATLESHLTHPQKLIGVLPWNVIVLPPFSGKIYVRNSTPLCVQENSRLCSDRGDWYHLSVGTEIDCPLVPGAVWCPMNIWGLYILFSIPKTPQYERSALGLELVPPASWYWVHRL